MCHDGKFASQAEITQFPLLKHCMFSHFCIALQQVRNVTAPVEGVIDWSGRWLVWTIGRGRSRVCPIPTAQTEPSLDSLCYIIYFMTANKRPAPLTLTDKRNSRARIGSQISAARSDSQSHALSPLFLPSSNHKQHQCDEVGEHGTCATRRLRCVYLLLFTVFEKDGLSASPSLLVSACLASFVIHRLLLLLRLSPFAALESGRRMEDLCIATCSVVMFT